jgi:hypothetical protein
MDRQEEKESDVKLAEALAERSDLDKKISALTQRITNAARYSEGETLPEDPGGMLVDLREMLSRRQGLVSRINLVNARTVITDPGGIQVTMTEALARRDRLNSERSLLTMIADAASPSPDPYGRGRRRMELPEKTSLPVAEIRRQADRRAAEHRELDTVIQQANWNTEL